VFKEVVNTMKCQEIKKIISSYLEEDLQPKQFHMVTEHLNGCSGCQRELEIFQKSWALLSHVENIEPKADYISRFWTEVSLRKPWTEKILEAVKEYAPQKRLIPALATACLILVMGFFAVKNYLYINDEKALASLSQDDLEMVQSMELAENYDIIEDIEFFEDLEIIENLDSLES